MIKDIKVFMKKTINDTIDFKTMVQQNIAPTLCYSPLGRIYSLGHIFWMKDSVILWYSCCSPPCTLNSVKQNQIYWQLFSDTIDFVETLVQQNIAPLLCYSPLWRIYSPLYSGIVCFKHVHSEFCQTASNGLEYSLILHIFTIKT